MENYKLPKDFLIGTAHSAFQAEGACDRDGKSETIMESYAKQMAGKPTGKGDAVYSTELPDCGCFFYDHYEEYIEDMHKTGQNTFRLSFSWSRIIPTGTGAVNPEGIRFYNRVIDKLLEYDIVPFVDLYHWDLPQCLQERGGFISEEFPEWYEAYAKVCFEAFGDRVKMWSTFNESQIAINNGYCVATFPPFIQDRKTAILAGHHLILGHYRAVRLYKSMNLGGKIGAVNTMPAITPARMLEEDVNAAELRRDWYFNWWTQPMLEGTYPQRVIRECEQIRINMPEHYQEDLDKWFVPMDFLGLNYYISSRTQYQPEHPLLSTPVESFYSAPGQRFTPYPAGLFDVVQYIALRYQNVELYITENGCALPNIHDEEKECDDPERISYIREHMRMILRCLRCGYNLKGYYYWCDADMYEELDGNNLRFGLTWVDHETGKRRWKKSRYYFSEICKGRIIN